MGRARGAFRAYRYSSSPAWAELGRQLRKPHGVEPHCSAASTSARDCEGSCFARVLRFLKLMEQTKFHRSLPPVVFFDTDGNGRRNRWKRLSGLGFVILSPKIACGVYDGENSSLRLTRKRWVTGIVGSSGCSAPTQIAYVSGKSSYWTFHSTLLRSSSWLVCHSEPVSASMESREVLAVAPV